MTLHVLSFPQIFLVKVTTWSLDYNTSGEATIAAGFIKISHLKKKQENKRKRKKKQIHFPVQHMYRYLYSYIFIYRRGRVLQNYIACVNQENLDKKTSKYTVWVVHKCFLSIKLGLFRHLYYQGYNQYADQTTDRLPDVKGKQVSTSSDQSRSTKQCNECVCESIL